jgi:hypothetical protein
LLLFSLAYSSLAAAAQNIPVVGELRVVSEACTLEGHLNMLEAAKNLKLTKNVRKVLKREIAAKRCFNFKPALKKMPLEVNLFMAISRPEGIFNLYSWKFEHNGKMLWSPWTERLKQVAT